MQPFLPSVLIVRGELNAPRTVDIRVDVGGLISLLLPRDGSYGRVELLRVKQPSKVYGFNNLKLHVTSGADLVEDPELEWDAVSGRLYFKAKLSPAMRDEKKNTKHRKIKRRRR